MKYYVYKITNVINNKWYIGKRKHPDPFTDSYMGSGKLIKRAIQKYGASNFKKEIINVFDTHYDAEFCEASLVTRDVVLSGISYNMHEGGKGGFAHLNDGGEQHILRAKKGGRHAFLKSKEHQNWGANNWKKNPEKQKEAVLKATITNKNRKRTNEFKKKLSDKQKANNWMSGKAWCVPIGCADVVAKSNRKLFFKDNIPDGWIKSKEQRALNTKNLRGFIWITNSLERKNKYIKTTDAVPVGWIKGRKKY